MKTIISTVAFQDEAGNVLSNGSLVFNIPLGQIYHISAGGQVGSQAMIVNLDATGKIPASVTLWASDELDAQPVYRVTICAQPNGIQTVGFVKWRIAGTSPIDVSQLPSQI
jgi:hypothetical protein